MVALIYCRSGGGNASVRRITMENKPTNLNKIIGNMMTFLSTLYPNADVKKIWCDPESAKIEFLLGEKPYTFEIYYNKWAEVNANG